MQDIDIDIPALRNNFIEIEMWKRAHIYAKSHVNFLEINRKNQRVCNTFFIFYRAIICVFNFKVKLNLMKEL